MFRFESPWAFYFLFLIPAALILDFFKHKIVTGYSALPSGLRPGWRSATRFIPKILLYAAFILIIIAAARPQKGLDSVRKITKGIAIELVIDHSSSMGTFMLRDGSENRLDQVKRVVTEFVMGNETDLTGRPDDFVGIIAFARYADTLSPLTISRDVFPGFISRITLVEDDPQEDGTAIGDGMALAGARLKVFEENMNKAVEDQKDIYEVKGKIIILLTDGENNAGEKTPEEAAELLKDWGVKLYVIGFGGGYARGLFGNVKKIRTEVSQAYADRMTSLAESTGGKFFFATDEEGLKSIYREINEIEKTEIETLTYTEYKEIFLPFASTAFFLILAALILILTLYRRGSE